MDIVDINGRKFSFEVNVGTMMKAEKELGVNLTSLLTNQEGLLTLSDPLCVCEYIYHLSDAPGRGITLEDFASGFKGDVLGAAMDAFNKEFTAFFQNPRMRRIVQFALEKIEEAQKEAVKNLESQQKIDEPATNTGS